LAYSGPLDIQSHLFRDWFNETGKSKRRQEFPAGVVRAVLGDGPILSVQQPSE
jgi:hypothetical protein